MDGVLSSWTAAAVSARWIDVRNRWGSGHAVQAALFAIALVSLEIGAGGEHARA
jgi:hypothetical protein